MKLVKLFRRAHCGSSGRRGFVSLPMVTILAFIISLSLLTLFRLGLMRRDQAAKAQLRSDYHQREESLLRALVAVFPQKAMDCMKADYAESDGHAWNTIFAEAVAMASAGESLPEATLDSLKLAAARRGNVADADDAQVQSWITSLGGVAGEVTPGTVDYADVFASEDLTGRIPPLLTMEAALQAADAARPIVTPDKLYATQAPGLQADIDLFPASKLYNLIAYPDIRFGYAAPGQPFVAKRNWWAFQVTYGTATGNETPPVPVLTKRYILSLYEIPSQMPIEAATFAEIGRHQNGVAWNSAKIEIDGSIYADRVSVMGGFGTDRVAGRNEVTIDGSIDLDGSTVGGDFDAPGVREQLQVNRNSDAVPVALSANSGRLTFLPLQRGGQFLRNDTTTAWEKYTRGASQCEIRVSAIEMVDIDAQLPTLIRVDYKTPGGTDAQVVLRRGDNWPIDAEVGGEAIPFQTELVLTPGSQSSCLVFFPERLNAWLVTNGGADVSSNRSIYFQTDSTVAPLTVRPLPAADASPDLKDMAVIIRKGTDLRAYTAGLSIVTPFRVYIGDDLNSMPQSGPPAGSGLPVGTDYFPPLSVFAAELRIGTTSFVRPFEHHGQVGTLISNSIGAWQPMDVKSGANDSVLGVDDVAAELSPLHSPAELPPVHQMNWLITIEEVPSE